jgi:L-ascorbate metabolism protein UlaG (beta-lactamase superfamily)
MMKIQLIRHATLRIEMNDKEILVDPMFSPAGAMDPVPDVLNQNRNPLVELPVSLTSLTHTDAIIVTHLHRDHFDETAQQQLPKHLSLFCQPEDEKNIREKGFTAVQSIKQMHTWNNITIHRTGGQHGTGEIGEKMGPVSGFVLSAENEPTLYITGDTIWCDEVKNALERYTPDVIVCFAGAAQFAVGAPITMTMEDIEQVRDYAPHAKIIVVHLEAWNHCRLRRQDIRDKAAQYSLQNIYIPEDGEIISNL